MKRKETNRLLNQIAGWGVHLGGRSLDSVYYWPLSYI